MICAPSMALAASAVLSTFPSPTMPLLIPVTVPVKLGLAVGARPAASPATVPFTLVRSARITGSSESAWVSAACHASPRAVQSASYAGRGGIDG